MLRGKRSIYLGILLIIVMGFIQPAQGSGEQTQATNTQTFSYSPLVGNDGRVYYEIFVRAFADGNGDGIGDFRGLTAKLDYLNDGNPATTNDLGVTGIWLMPINASPSYHGYDVTDYTAVNPDYGTMKDFENLIREAHKRGIKVIIDLVLNHTSSQHPWFKAAVKKTNYRDYYIWGDASKAGEIGPLGGQVWRRSAGGYYYALFWDGMPDLNYSNPAVKKEMFNVAAFWLKKGVDGFRLDAVKHIFNDPKDNYAFLQEFKAAVQQVNPDAYIVGEVWDTPAVMAPYFRWMQSNFDFPEAELIHDRLLQKNSANLAEELKKMYDAYQTANPQFIDAPFLSNHDQNRIMSELGGRMDVMKLAAAIYLTLPGNPFIYYGEEIGMRGTKPDERIREPFQWKEGDAPEESHWEFVQNNEIAGLSVEAQLQNPASLLNWYRRLIALRNTTPALAYGNFVPLKTGTDLMAFRREWKSDKVLVVHNLSDKWAVLPSEIFAGANYTRIFNEQVKNEINLVNGDSLTRLAPYGTVILKAVE